MEPGGGGGGGDKRACWYNTGLFHENEQVSDKNEKTKTKTKTKQNKTKQNKTKQNKTKTKTTDHHEMKVSVYAFVHDVPDYLQLNKTGKGDN